MSNHYLDVALGLSSTFLALSLLCSATREAIASLFQTRAKVLLDGVLTLLHEPVEKPRLRSVLLSLQRLFRISGGFGLRKLEASSLTADVMCHPLITGLAQEGRMPSYIPSSIFARAFVATLTAKYGKLQTASALLDKLGNDGLARTLLAIMGEGPDDAAALENAVRLWYETVMDRITGWYKRRSQFVLFLVGLFYAAAMNVDALQLSQRLWSDEAAAAALAQQTAEGVASGRIKLPAPSPDATPQARAAEAKKDAEALQALPLPIGWPATRFEAAAGQGAGAFLHALAFALMGWIVTAFAASLGSPFWFDGIGWLLALRGSGAKPAAEGSAGPAEPLGLPSLRKNQA